MRLPLKRGFSPFYTVSVSVSDRTRRHRVELWQQPWHRWAAARIYHWYDMRVHRLPGFELLERVKKWRHRYDEPLSYLPISAKQDCRCYHLSVKSRTVLAVLDVDQETYDKLKRS